MRRARKRKSGRVKSHGGCKAEVCEVFSLQEICAVSCPSVLVTQMVTLRAVVSPNMASPPVTVVQRVSMILRPPRDFYHGCTKTHTGWFGCLNVFETPLLKLAFELPNLHYATGTSEHSCHRRLTSCMCGTLSLSDTLLRPLTNSLLPCELHRAVVPVNYNRLAMLTMLCGTLPVEQRYRTLCLDHAFLGIAGKCLRKNFVSRAEPEIGPHRTSPHY